MGGYRCFRWGYCMSNDRYGSRGSGSTFLMGGGGVSGRGDSQYRSYGEDYSASFEAFEDEKPLKSKKSSELSPFNNKRAFGETADAFRGGDATTTKRQRVQLFWAVFAGSIVLSVIVHLCSTAFSGGNFVKQRRSLIERSSMTE